MTTREYSPGEHLQGDIDVDVAIVGGGFTGLSSAYHIKKAEPNLRVALLESQVIGFGASGRNGGFNMTLFGLTLSITAFVSASKKPEKPIIIWNVRWTICSELCQELNIDCDYEHPGFLRVATSEKYKKRILHEIELAHELGWRALSGSERNQDPGTGAKSPCIWVPGGSPAAAFSTRPSWPGDGSRLSGPWALKYMKTARWCEIVRRTR